MLYKFMYLDEPALEGYVSALEDGLRQRLERSAGKMGGKSGELDAKVAKLGGTSETSEELTEELADTASARFARLLSVAPLDEEGNAWAQLPNLGGLDDVGIGTLIDVECDAYIPDQVRYVSSGELGEALDTLNALRPMAEQFGFDMTGIPSESDARIVQSALAHVKFDLVFVGEDDSSEWKIAGRLKKDSLRDSDIDGPLRVVGKVTQVWPETKWKPLLALPGASLVPREQRRALEAHQPSEAEQDQYLKGPAAMLDVLALYR